MPPAGADVHPGNVHCEISLRASRISDFTVTVQIPEIIGSRRRVQRLDIMVFTSV